MKKIILNLIIIFSFFAFLSPILRAEENNFGREIKRTIRETVEEGKETGISPREIRKNVREEVKEKIQERKEGLFEQVKNFIKKNLRFDARLTCKIITLNPAFTVDCDGKSYMISISDKTRYIRNFGGKSSFAELEVGNEINVFGKFTDESKTTVDAKLIRNLSIQKKWGVFFGEVAQKNQDNFIIKTIKRGDQTVYFGPETKFLSHKKETINYADLQIGNRVRVKGVWDKSINKITEVEEVRVFPQKSSVTPTP